MDNNKDSIAGKISRRKTQRLFMENRQGLLLSLFVTSAVCGLLTLQVGWQMPMLWWSLAVVMILVRLVVYCHYRSGVADGSANFNRALNAFVISTLAYGVVWGLGAAHVASHAPFDLMLLILLVLISLSVGAVPYLFYSMLAIGGYIVTLIAPLCVWLFFEFSYHETLAGMTALVFAVSTYIMALKFHQVTTDSLRLELENAALSDQLLTANDELKKLSRTDSLTGLLNRRAFEESFSRGLAASRREGESVTLMMLDIDHFKPFNDEHGHIAGDEAIVAVAEILRRSFRRPGDLVGRYGGEEFVAFLKNADREGAEKVAEAVRQDIAGIHQERNDLLPGPLTLSIGVVCLNADEVGELQGLIASADEALYRAKEQGRNQVVFA